MKNIFTSLFAVLIFGAFAGKVHAQCGIITTVVGNGTSGFSGDGGAATAARIYSPDGIAFDTSGNIYIADSYNNRVRKISTSGIISTVAGNGATGSGGDGGAATAASLNQPYGVAVDRAGNIYIADAYNNKIRKVNTSGIISTIAGNGTAGYTGDGGMATAAEFDGPYGIAVDTSGNLYVADLNNNRIRKVNVSGTISTVAGNGTPGYTGDGGAATAGELYNPINVALDGLGNLYIADYGNHRIRKVSTSGIISTTAGNGTGSYGGDGGAATAAALYYPIGLAFDGAGNVYIADANNNRIRKVNASGIISTIAGNGSYSYGGDGGAPTAAAFSYPSCIALDGAGNLYIADQDNYRIRKITSGGPIVGAITGSAAVTVGGATFLSDTTTGGTWSTSNAAIATVNASGIVRGIATGNVTISYTVTTACGTTYVTKAMTSVNGDCNAISTIAGTGTSGYTGDGGAATSANIQLDYGIAVDGSGNIFISDDTRHIIRKITPAGIISKIAGTGAAGSSGDGGQATAAKLDQPHGLAVDASGNLYVADYNNNKIRKITPAGIISTVVGTGSLGSAGDGGAATACNLYNPYDVKVDASGNLFIADYGNDRIRKVTAAGIISTVAGNGGGAGFSGDGGPATAAQLNQPRSVAVDASGNIYIGDIGNDRIRKVNTAGLISTFAGTVAGFSGDGGPATAARFNNGGHTSAIAADALGNIYFSDYGNNVIKRVGTDGIINTYVGSAFGGYSGDGGLAIAAGIYGPGAITFDGSGNMYICDGYNYRVRKVTNLGYAAAAITGATTVAVGSTTTLSNTTSGGTWTTSSASIASVNSSGVVTGVAVGSATITYSVTNSCGTSVATRAMTVTSSSSGCNIITTIAGNGSAGYSGDGGAATAAAINRLIGVVTDVAGNIYVADYVHDVIRRINPSGNISTFAGTGVTGSSGDGGPATAAKLNGPSGLAIDNSGNIYIADYGNRAIRKVATSGIITTVAGGGSGTSENILATIANISYPSGVAIDAGGNIFISDYTNNKIRKVNASGFITTYAGNGFSGFSGDGGAATAANLHSPLGLAVDAPGNLYITDMYNNRVRVVNTSGIIRTFAGNGSASSSGDGGAATAAGVFQPKSVWVDVFSNVYIGDSDNVIRKVNSSGLISRVVGTGASGFGGDGGVATAATMTVPAGGAVDAYGNLYFTDRDNHRLRKVSGGSLSVGTLSGSSTIAVGSTTTLSASGGTWSSSNTAVATVSTSGVVYGVTTGSARISYSVFGSCSNTIDTLHITVVPISTSCGAITTIAGIGTAGYSGDGGAATASTFYSPMAVVVDATGNIYVGDYNNNVVRVIRTTGVISTFAGTGAIGRTGDGGPATAAKLYGPYALAVDNSGNLYIADYGNGCIRKVSTSGIITTVAGGGFTSGDGIAATNANITYTTGVAVDASGNLYLSDYNNNKIRKVNTSGIISTYAGNGFSGFSGDGGVATAANIHSPLGLAIDVSGNLYIADSYNNRVRMVSTSGIIRAFAGSGLSYSAGDGGAATAAGVSQPNSVWTDAFNNVYIADGDYVVRKVNSSGVISKVVGTGTSGFSGDGGSATSAMITLPAGGAIDGYGNIYIADRDNSRIRKIASGNPVVGAITGTSTVTVGSTTTLSDTTAGGTWTTSSVSIASVNSSGVVTGVAAGSATISYAVTNSCGTGVATRAMTVTAPSVSCNIITTIAGTGTSGYSGDGGAATAAKINLAQFITGDGAGNYYFSDYSNHRVRKISATGVISTIAGTGTSGFSGDGGPATAAMVNYPSGITIDGAGNLYFSDLANYRIRKINTSGIITTIAGTGAPGATGDGGAATAATLYNPMGLKIDAAGNIYFADNFNHKIRKISTSGIITTIAGTGSSGRVGDGGPATSATLNAPTDIAFDRAGNMYIADKNNYLIRMVTPAGTISTFAGTYIGVPVPGYSGDGGPATAAKFDTPTSLGIDAIDNLFISDFGNAAIRRIVLSSGIVTTVSGNGTAGYSGDNGPASAAILGNPQGLFVDAASNIVEVEPYGNRIRKISSGNPAVGVITGTTTLAVGSTTTLSDTTAGGTWTTSNASIASVNSSGVVTGAAAGSATISYAVTNSCGTGVATRGMTVTAPTCPIVISTYAGNGSTTYSGDAGTAIAAGIGRPIGVATDAAGNLYIAEQYNNRIRKVSSAGIITTIAGTGTIGYSGDGGPATAASIYAPYEVALDATGNIYFTDEQNNCVRKINTSGIISTIAGNGTAGFAGDGGPATAARMNTPRGLDIDAAGNLYIVDRFNYRVRKISPSGTIATVAGTGTNASSADGGPATAASLFTPLGVAIDPSGNIYISEYNGNKVRKVNPSGIISTFAGNGTSGYTGDGGPATAATLGLPTNVVSDAAGNIYISELANHAIRLVSPAGIISTLAGNGSSGFSGDGGAPTAASFDEPDGIAVDAAGNVFCTDWTYNRVRKIGTGVLIGAITGASTLTVGSTTTLSDTTAGGTWTTSSASIASVNSSGVVTGVAAGSAVITYSVSNTCGSSFDTALLTVSAAASVSCNIITTIAGYGPYTSSGDGGPATNAAISSPYSIAMDNGGNIYVCDLGRIRKINTAGIISTFAGTGMVGYSGDGGPASAATFGQPGSLTFDVAGNLYFCDGTPNVVRKITPAGIISTVAGNGSAGFSGDGGAATSAALNNPLDVAFDASGNMLISDNSNSRIRKVTTSGVISTIAGNTGSAAAGDGGPATAAGIYPGGITVSTGGDIYVSDLSRHTVRMISPLGIISTIAGTGSSGFSGDGGPATAAKLNSPYGLSIDAGGNVYVCDASSNRVRKVSPAGIINTVAGDGSTTFGGDGGDATAASLYTPHKVIFDPAGNYYIADNGHGRVRKVTTGVPAIGAITGASTLTVGSITTLSDTTAGGTWTTSTASIASVNSSGVVTGVAAGSATITYAVTNSCGTSVATAAVTVTAPSSGCNIITTIAGNGTSANTGDGGAATSASIAGSQGIVKDAAGNIYFASGDVIRKVTPSGVISTFAGTGVSGYSGDGGQATAAKLNNPLGMAFDASGNLYFADRFNNRVRKISTSGIISTAAGTGTYTSTGDGGPAVGATLGWPADVTFDAAGNMYIADEGGEHIRKVNTSGIISTIGGNATGMGSGGFSGDGGQATAAAFNAPVSIAVDPSGNVFVSDFYNNRIRKINTSGIISTYAGNGTAGYAGDGGPATAAQINQMWGIRTDGSGNLYIADATNNRIRKVSTSGIISTVAGTGAAGFSGDGGAATAAAINNPGAVFIDGSGNIYICDGGNNMIRKIGPGTPAIGAITGTTAVSVGATTTLSDTTAGGSWTTSSASIASVNASGVVTGVASGSAIITYTVSNSCGSSFDTALVTVNAAAGTCNIITTIAGNNTSGYSGDGGAATSAMMNTPYGIARDAAGNVYVSEYSNNIIRKITTAGIISTFAGTGTGGFSGDGGQATAAKLSQPTGIAFDASGNLFVADAGNNRIRKISPAGIISTAAGTGTTGSTGDGGAATAATLTGPDDVFIDAAGNLFVADYGNNRIRVVNTSGIISAFAGTGTSGYSGDGGSATAAMIANIHGMAKDLDGNFYFGSNNSRIRMVTPSGVISTFAGNGTSGYSGDGGPATAAKIGFPGGIAFDPAGNLIISDNSNKRLRKVNTASNIISTIAGTGVTGYAGDGGPATVAQLNFPYAITTDNSSNIYIADYGNNVVRKIVAGTAVVGPVTGSSSVCVGSSVTMSDTTTGGSWVTYSLSVATISGSGVVTATASGTANITYSKANACGLAIATKAVTINTVPAAGTIVGPTTVCVGNTIALTDTPAGGAWSNGGSSIATVSTTGVVFGIAAGTAIITYARANSCGTTSDFLTVTVTSTASAGTISGASSVCVGATTTLTTTGTGGNWSSSNSAIASVSSTGVVSGVAAGSVIISYAISGSCGTATTTYAMTVNPLPNAGTIAGPSTVCAGSSITLTDTASGGVWSNGGSSIATVSSGGVVFGIAAGSAVISYTKTNTCGSVSATQTVTVTSGPSAGTISGASSVCVAATTTLSTSATGGAWSSSNAAIATVIATGAVTGVSAGSAVISYTVSGTCGTAIATYSMTVNPLPNAGTISGATSVCEAATTTLTDAASGGTWSSSNTAIASVSTTGVVRGIAGGSALISYTVTNGCGTVSATSPMTVNPLPSPGSISGTTTVCPGTTSSLTNAVTGGVWSTANASVASVDASGLLTGVALGTTTISYAVTNSCGTTYATIGVTVTASPNAGTVTAGAASICVAATTTVTDGVAGGVWSSSNTTIATVSATGIVTGLAAGIDTIIYTVTSSCGSATASTAITVIASVSAGTISGVTTFCQGANNTLTDAITGGTWSSSNPAIASVSTTGVVRGVAPGTAIISYTVTTACGTAVATKTQTVNPLPTVAAITGANTACAGYTSALADATAGGTWSTSNASIASVNSGGLVTGVAVGSATITYSVTNSCGVTRVTTTFTVTTGATAGTISGAAAVCAGMTTALTDGVSGGAWTSSNSAVATISSTGVVTGVSAGTATITYTVTTSCGTAFTTAGITVNPAPDAGAITGPATVCPGATITLSDAAAGGTWSTTNAAVASVDASGVVTGIATAGGTDTIIYSVTNSCGTATASATITVTPSPSSATISGTTTMCVGASNPLTASLAGGAWSSSNAAIATVSAGGSVTGVANGTAIITYTLTNVCGTAAITTSVTINTTPSAGTITGASTVCQGAAITLADATTGGTWRSSNTTVATISAIGVVTGVGAGTATISYVVITACGTGIATTSITVTGLPSAGTISGPSSVCAGSAITLTDAATGGTWTTSNAAIASVNPSTGSVTGVAAGSATITYTVVNSCGSRRATASVTVGTPPSAGTITGTTTICAGGGTSALSDAVAGGTWSSSDVTIASVDAAGIVTGVGAGTATISYTITGSCGATSATTTVTVNAGPTVAAITGASVVCTGASVSLADATAGGTWSSSDATIASVDASGVVSGISGGSVTITYSVTTACGSGMATAGITVNTPPATAGSIAGLSSLCPGSTAVMSDTTAGGTWSSSNTSVATISASGVVTGRAIGSATISYTLTNSCGSVSATLLVSVTTGVSAGTISGSATVCTGVTTTYTDTVSGGVWTSSNSTIAAVSSAGVVTGVAVGTAFISYTVTNSCGTAIATRSITVSASPVAGTISGTTALCVGSPVTLTDAAAGGSWSSSDVSVATISAGGTVTPVAAGTAIISYTVTNSCGTAVATASITVSSGVTAGTITGASTTCTGVSTILTDAVTGGTWSSSNPSVASVDPSGVVTGVAAGTVTITYTVTNGCGTATATTSMTINAIRSPGTITGASTLCSAGGGATLVDTVSGGIWSSSDVSVVTVSTSGVITGLSAGTAIVSYTISTICGPQSATLAISVTAGASAGTITGTTAICAGTTTTLSDAVTGGTWSSSSSSIATVSASGVVTGLAAGTAVISYTVTSGCGSASATATVTVSASPSAGTITGSGTVCIGATTTYTDAVTGGTWSTSNASIASVNGTGVVSGISNGTATISYTVTNSCGTAIATSVVTVSAGTTVAAITGTTTFCAGATSALADATTGGTWSSSNAAIATISASGIVTGVAGGTAVISYTVTGGCGSTSATTTVTINPLPSAGTITGTTSVCVGGTSTLSDAIAGGVWSTSNAAVATVSTSGAVRGVSAGTVTISYAVTNSCGTVATTAAVTVTTGASAGSITGATTLCAGTTSTLSNTVTGGVWSSSNTAIATVSTTGIVTGVTGGSAVISYTVTTSCGTGVATATVTINPLPSAGSITGGTSVCIGSTTALADAVAGGSWSSSNTAIATVSATGVVAGVSAGSAVISYTVTNSCGSTSATITIVSGTAAPTGHITPAGPVTLCGGSPVNLSAVSGSGGLAYRWFKNGVLITGATSANYTATISGVYVAIISNGCGADTLTGVTVLASPNPVISLAGAHTLSTGSFSSYQWFLNSVAIAGANSSTYVYSTPGVYTVRVTNSTGCAVTSAPFTVSGGSSNGITEVNKAPVVTIYPNPSNSIVHISADVKVNVVVTTATGRVVVEQHDATDIDLGRFADGMYMIMVYDENNLLLKAEKLIKVE